MHALLATVQAMSADDLLLAISYSGERREINMAAAEALRVGSKILAITGFTPTRCSSRLHSAFTPLLKSRRRAAQPSPPPARK